MLSTKAQSILKLLVLNDKTPITAKAIASMLDMSERSVQTYLKEVSAFCQEKQIPYVSKRGLGIYLELRECDRELLRPFVRGEAGKYDEKHRIFYILRVLLEGWENYTVALFSEELYVSRGMILQDLEQVEKWAGEHELTLVRKGKKGLLLEGAEVRIRTALAALGRMEGGSQDGPGPMKDQPGDGLGHGERDYRLEASERQRMEALYGRDSMSRICRGLKEFERRIRADMTDYSFCMLVEYLCIQCMRIKGGRAIAPAEAHCLLEDWENESSGLLTDILEQYTGLFLQESEKRYTAVLLAGAEFQKKGGGGEEQDYLLSRDALSSVCSRMISHVSGSAGLDLTSDQALGESMERFLNHSLVRTKFRLLIRNPFLDDIKQTYYSVFTTCYSLGKLYREYAGILPSEHEIAFLTLLVGGAMVRVDKRVKAVFVGAGGLLNARLAAERIERMVSDVQIGGILSTDEIRRAPRLDCDILITTLPGFQHRLPVISITPLVGERDVIKLKREINALFTKKQSPAMLCTLADYMKPSFMLLDEEPDSKESLIRRACSLLEQGGYVNGEYYKEVLHREAVSSTEINYGVAIPHGIENHVLKPAVVLIRLKQKMDWGNGPVDIIFLLALNFDEIALTRRFFKVFYEKVGDRETVEQIRRAASKENILELLQ